MRKVIFWLHLITGSIAGIVVLIMAATGVVLTFERSAIAFADRGYRPHPPFPGAIHLQVDELLARVKAARNAAPSGLLLRSDPAAPAEAAFGRESTVLLNPYTGTVLGPSAPDLRRFFREVEEWHRFLGRQDRSRPLGRTVTGVCTLAFLLLLISGPVLWLPKKWTWQHLRPSLLFRGELRGRARDWNWHNVIGFWCAIPLFFIVVTGVIMSFPGDESALPDDEDRASCGALAGSAPRPADSGNRAQPRSWLCHKHDETESAMVPRRAAGYGMAEHFPAHSRLP